MPPSSTRESRSETLLKHLDGLFALAQIVSASPDEAVRLVEATFRRAFTTEVDVETSEEMRLWLFRLLMQIRREQAGISDDAGGEAAVPSGPTESALADFRRRLSEQFVDRILPAAFVALPHEHRVLLMLCDIQHLTCSDAGDVLELDAQTACARLEEARAGLHRAVLTGASNLERKVLEAGLPPSWRAAALQRMAESELVAVPPTLAPSIAATDTGGVVPRTSAVPAAPPVKEEVPTRSIHLAKRLTAAVLVIAVAGLLGYGFSNLMQRQPNRNLISLSASQAAAVEASFQTASPEQAERYVFDRLGLRITVPTINQAVLEGVSIRDVADDAEVPVLVYRNASESGTVVIYVYSYAFLDRHEKRLNIGEDILRQIEQEGNFDLHDLGEEKALVWRRRDDILVAITSADAEELRRRITYPS